MPDAAILQIIVQGGATAAFLWLVIDTRKEAAKREELMRASFVEREGKFLKTIEADSDKFIAALEHNTQMLASLDAHLTDSLDEMRRKIT